MTLWLDFSAESPSGFHSESALLRNLAAAPKDGARVFLIDPRDVWGRAGAPRSKDGVPVKVDPDSFVRQNPSARAVLNVLSARIPLPLFFALHSDIDSASKVPWLALAFATHEGSIPTIQEEFSAEPLIRNALDLSCQQTEAGAALDALLDCVSFLRSSGAPPACLHTELRRLLESSGGPTVERTSCSGT